MYLYLSCRFQSITRLCLHWSNAAKCRERLWSLSHSLSSECAACSRDLYYIHWPLLLQWVVGFWRLLEDLIHGCKLWTEKVRKCAKYNSSKKCNVSCHYLKCDHWRSPLRSTEVRVVATLGGESPPLNSNLAIKNRLKLFNNTHIFDPNISVIPITVLGGWKLNWDRLIPFWNLT